MDCLRQDLEVGMCDADLKRIIFQGQMHMTLGSRVFTSKIGKMFRVSKIIIVVLAKAVINNT